MQVSLGIDCKIRRHQIITSMNKDDQSIIDVELGEITYWFRMSIHFCEMSVSRAVCNDKPQRFRSTVGVLGC